MPITDEFDLIDKIQKWCGKPSSSVIKGIGDDGSVLRFGNRLLVSTVDCMVEGVHFDLAYTTPFELGQKAMVVNLSDLAAMGAVPRFAHISLGLPQDTSEYFVEELYRGFKKIIKPLKCDIVGGNIVQSPQSFFIDVLMLGEATTYLTRDNVKPGDLLCVSGFLGASAAGLQIARNFGRELLDQFEALKMAHLTPVPRLKLGQVLNHKKWSISAIDVSDGLAKEIHHLATRSNVGFLIQENNIPLHAETLKACENFLNHSPLSLALFGGEDYELLFTVPKSAQNAVLSSLKKLKIPISIIGEATPARSGVVLEKKTGEKTPLKPFGWNHFVKRRQIPSKL